MNRQIDILVVEDDAHIATVLTARLESLGYRVCGVAATGTEAISGVFRHHPDLVTMDIILKGEMTGIEAAAKIAESSSVPIIYITCLSEGGVFERAIKTNPYGFIVKPYDIHELRSTIDIAMVKHEAAETRDLLIRQLKNALSRIRALRGLLPICAACKRIRNTENDRWQQIEEYIADHSTASFTHSICPDCADRLYPELALNQGDPVD